MPRETILIRGDAQEYRGINGGSVLTPGHLVALQSDETWDPHASAGGAAALLFVREQHENAGANIADTIAAGDDITVLAVVPGAKINCVTSDTLAIGDFVESAGDGSVRIFGSGVRLGVCTTASDLTNNRVEVIVGYVG